jgi:pimeloyl-ACP methyl ester carboxylesterase
MPTVTLPHGGVIAYREAGRVRPPLLLVHGAASSSLCFAELVSLLGRQRRAVALDLPGHGRSPAFAAAGVPSTLLERYRDVVAELAEQLGLGRFVLAGHSMGGAVALRFALDLPERLERLVLIATGARLPVAPELTTLVRERFAELPALLAASGFSPESEPRAVARWAARQVQAPPEVALADFKACALHDLRDRLESLRVPTLVLSAADDRLTPPRLQQQLAQRIPGARLTTLTRAGHLLTWERPEALAQAMLAP